MEFDEFVPGNVFIIPIYVINNKILIPIDKLVYSFIGRNKGEFLRFAACNFLGITQKQLNLSLNRLKRFMLIDFSKELDNGIFNIQMLQTDFFSIYG